MTVKTRLLFAVASVSGKVMGFFLFFLLFCVSQTFCDEHGSFFSFLTFSVTENFKHKNRAVNLHVAVPGIDG